MGGHSRRFGVAVASGCYGGRLGLALGAPAPRLLLWMGLGVILWSAGLTLAAALGLAGIGALRH